LSKNSSFKEYFSTISDQPVQLQYQPHQKVGVALFGEYSFIQGELSLIMPAQHFCICHKPALSGRVAIIAFNSEIIKSQLLPLGL